MKIEITSLNISYQSGAMSGVQIYYNGYNEERTINLNGYLPLSVEEYSGNESIDSLTKMVKVHLVNALTEPTNAA